MGVLYLLSYLGGIAAFLFVTLSLASGLLWLAELIEEHSKYAKVIGMRAIYTIIALHVILIFTDSLPVLPTLLSIFAHLIYLTNFSATWPYISLTSPRFLASCVLVVADHFTWFFHFAAKAQEAKRYRQPKYRYGTGTYSDGPAFMDVAAFFAICVWFVPLFLFLSLSANDNALPSFDSAAASAPASPSHGGPVDLSSPGPYASQSQSHRQIRARNSTSLVKSLLTPLISILPRLKSRRKNDEGIIAPRTPIRGSPLHSPVPMSQATSYFPWADEKNNNGGSTPTSSTNTYNLNPEAMRNRNSRTPPPPRRVVSEAAVKGLNPRGLATRQGVPPAKEEEAEGDLLSSGRPSLSVTTGESTGPKMSLGPREGEKLTTNGAEMVVTEGPMKRKGKAD